MVQGAQALSQRGGALNQSLGHIRHVGGVVREEAGGASEVTAGPTSEGGQGQSELREREGPGPLCKASGLRVDPGALEVWA